MRTLTTLVALVLLAPVPLVAAPGPAAVAVEFRIAHDETCATCEKVEFHSLSSKRPETLYLGGIEISNADIAGASLRTEGHISAVIVLVMSEAGRFKLAELTGANIGKRLAILVGGTVLAAPRIQGRVENGVAHVTGRFTREEAEGVVEALGGAPR